MRRKRQESEELLQVKRKKMNEDLKKVIEKQGDTPKFKEEELKEEVTHGIEEMLTDLTKRNLLLKEKNSDLNAIVLQKNSHIARIMKELREIKKERDSYMNQVSEAKLLL